MSNETTITITDERLRETYEPYYGRILSDEELDEIRTNLMAFAECFRDAISCYIMPDSDQKHPL